MTFTTAEETEVLSYEVITGVVALCPVAPVKPLPEKPQQQQHWTKCLLVQSDPHSFTCTVSSVSNNRESPELLEAFPPDLQRNKDASEYKSKRKRQLSPGKKTIQKLPDLICQGQGHILCQQAQLCCPEAILLHLLEHTGLYKHVLNTERKLSTAWTWKTFFV